MNNPHLPSALGLVGLSEASFLAQYGEPQLFQFKRGLYQIVEDAFIEGYLHLYTLLRDGADAWMADFAVQQSKGMPHLGIKITALTLDPSAIAPKWADEGVEIQTIPAIPSDPLPPEQRLASALVKQCDRLLCIASSATQHFACRQAIESGKPITHIPPDQSFQAIKAMHPHAHAKRKPRPFHQFP